MINVRPADRTAEGTPSGARTKRLGRRLWEARWIYAFLLPGVVLSLLFSVWPVIGTWYYSFFTWDGISKAMYWAGLGNYQELVHDPVFWADFGRSFIFMAVTTPVEVGLALIVAVVLNERSLTLAPIYRTLFFLPVVMSTAIMSIVMQFVFAAYDGPVNTALIDLHLLGAPVPWLGTPGTVLITAMVIFVWKWMGQPMIYWLAALQTVPPELYEAARVDGARAWEVLRRVTVPLVAPFGAIILFIQAAGNLNVFAFLYALTGGGPGFSSETMELYIFRWAFGASTGVSGGESLRLGYACAAGIFFGIAVMFIALPQVGLVAKLRETNVARGLST